jgi:hypothetical protein
MNCAPIGAWKGAGLLLKDLQNGQFLFSIHGPGASSRLLIGLDREPTPDAWLCGCSESQDDRKGRLPIEPDKS